MIHLCSTCGCKDAESFEAEEDRMEYLEHKAKKLYLDEVEDIYIQEICDEYDLDFNDEKDYSRACSKYIGQVPYIHILDMLDSDEYSELKDYYKSQNIGFYKHMNAESFEAETWGVQIYDTGLTMADVKKMLKDAGIKTKGSVRKIGNGYGYYFKFDSSHQSKFEKAFKKFGKAGNYEYEAESFEGESPMMKNITAIGVLALAIIIGKKMKR